MGRPTYQLRAFGSHGDCGRGIARCESSGEPDEFGAPAGDGDGHMVSDYPRGRHTNQDSVIIDCRSTRVTPLSATQ